MTDATELGSIAPDIEIERDYYGTKMVTAWPEPRAYADVADPHEEPGYAVRYADGYTSWSPWKAFEAAYQPVTAMDFGRALQAMRDGYMVRRPHWDEGCAIQISDGLIVGSVGQLSGGGTHKDILATDWTIITGAEGKTSNEAH